MASAGLMTNYLYSLNEVDLDKKNDDYRQIVDSKGNNIGGNLSTVEGRKEHFKKSEGEIIMSRQVRDILYPP